MSKVLRCPPLPVRWDYPVAGNGLRQFEDALGAYNRCSILQGNEKNLITELCRENRHWQPPDWDIRETNTPITLVERSRGLGMGQCGSDAGC